MRNAVALITALLLLVSQAGVWSATPDAKPCCHNCGGACCVKSGSLPAVPQPLAPVSANPAPVLKLAAPPLLVVAEFVAAEFSPPVAAPRAPLIAPSLPLFLRQCALLV